MDVRSSSEAKQTLQRGKYGCQLMGWTLKQSKIWVSEGNNLVFFSHIVYLPDAPLSTSTCLRNIVGLFVSGQNTSVPSAGSVRSSWVSEPPPQKHQQLSFPFTFKLFLSLQPKTTIISKQPGVTWPVNGMFWVSFGCLTIRTCEDENMILMDMMSLGRTCIQMSVLHRDSVEAANVLQLHRHDNKVTVKSHI